MQLFRQIETRFRTGTTGGLTDGQLLERFVQRRDDGAEAAFAALVDRHAAMVLRVCRQILGDEHDAQDASQATFLVLARRAGSIGRRESVGCWLHGVALRVAAKARVAAARRRAHERRGAAMAAGRTIEEPPITPEDRERWTSLHEELGRLPEAFRAPLVLCYLEGLTQEQAAAQLQAPLGTIQSRLARGRAKLKARLEQRGVDASATIPGAAFTAAPPSPAPADWVEATIRLATRFSHGKTAGIAADSAVATLAEEILRAMLIGKIKVVVGMILFATILVTGVATWATWARQVAKKDQEPPPEAINAAIPIVKKQGAFPPRPETPPLDQSPPYVAKRTLRGIVRDEQGRPVAKAWIGDGVEPMLDVWSLITSPDRIRVAGGPYRDQTGTIVPAGSLGRYFEYRDDSRKWHPVHPGDIRRFEPSRSLQFALSPQQQADAAKILPNGLLEIRLAKGRQWMKPLNYEPGPAARTDPQGRFAIEVGISLPRQPVRTELLPLPHDLLQQAIPAEVHFASPDLLRQAVHVVRSDEPDRPIDVTLRPTRLVRARVVEDPKDHPEVPLSWRVFSVDSQERKASSLDAFRGMGASWDYGPHDDLEDPAMPNGERRLEARLTAGRYKVRFKSFTTERLVDLVVPEGDGPLDLPDIHLESLAWVKMMGRPAAEITAINLENKPVKLADHRGKVVVLQFWGTRYDDSWGIMDQWVKLHKRFKDQPLVFLAVHDASATSVDAFKTAAAPLLDRYLRTPEAPVELLLDRPPTGRGAGPYGLRAGERGSGQTSDRYEVVQRTTFVIDKNGRLAFALVGDYRGNATFTIGKDGEAVQEPGFDPSGIYMIPVTIYEADAFASAALLAALEDQLGLPRTAHPESKRRPVPDDLFQQPPLPDGPVLIAGKVVGPDGKPVAGARISPMFFEMREKDVKTDPTGAFSFTVDNVSAELSLRLEASGLATRTIWAYFRREGGPQEPEGSTIWSIEPSGRIDRPLRMSPGVVVTGRVVRRGKPVPGVTMIARQVDSVRFLANNSYIDGLLPHNEARTDDQGHFRIAHVGVEKDRLFATGRDLGYAIYARPGSLENHQTVVPRKVSSGLDGETVDLGDFEARAGHTLAGRVIVSDGKSLPPEAKLYVRPENSDGFLSSLDAAGRFEVKGISDGSVSVSMMLPARKGRPAAGLPDYRFSPRNNCLDPTFPDRLQGMVDRDINDLTILLEPGETPERVSWTAYGIDPALVADFNDAKAGPITGVPPGYDPKGP